MQVSVAGATRQDFSGAFGDSEERFRAIFYQAPVGMAQTTLQGEWLLLNDCLCRMLGFTQAELRAKRFFDITHPDDLAASQAVVRQLLNGEIQSHALEKRFVRKDGSIFWGRMFKWLVRDNDDRPQSFISVVEDITERIQAERALRESEQRLTLVQSAAHLGICEWDLRSDTVTYSGEYAQLYGLAPGHPLTRAGLREQIHPDDRERFVTGVQEALEQTRAWDTEYRVLWPDGSVHWLLSKGSVFLDDAGRPLRSTGIILDITESKRVEAELRESEERFRNMADTAPVMIWVTGPDKLATFFNKCCLDFTGHSLDQKIGEGWMECLHPEDREWFLAKYSSAFEDRQEFHAVFRLRRADGEYRWVLTAGSPRSTVGGLFAGFIGSCIDITMLKRTQEEALARQKLESLGVLAGGIAHDFNNLLGAILAEAELITADLAADLSPNEEVARIKSVAIRGAEIVRQLMIYAGQDQATLIEPVNLSHLVEEMLELLRVSAYKQVVLKVNLRPKLPAVLGNAPQIRQVVMNLVINASEAIGENEGSIQVATSRVTLGQGSALDNVSNLPPGDYVQLEVSDTGCGMTEDARAKIFDPFYTTKFAGRGMGLAVVQGIVREQGGAVHVVSAPGQGATFVVLLPCASKEALNANSVTSPEVEQSNETGTITILVVEDEEVLRRAVSKSLRHKRFTVLEAKDGSAAINLVGTHEQHIDVLLLDVTLPGRSSREVFEEAHRMRPGLKIILTSAYGKERVLSGFNALPVEHFIRKPFQLAELVNLIQVVCQ